MKTVSLASLAFFCQLIVTNAVAQMSGARAESVSRCFFVYAPMYEVSAKTNDDKLRSYATQRLMYVRGVLESSMTDPLFKRVFEQNLSKNKGAGVRIEQGLMEAHRNGDAAQYNSEVSKASACDKELGL